MIHLVLIRQYFTSARKIAAWFLPRMSLSLYLEYERIAQTQRSLPKIL